MMMCKDIQSCADDVQMCNDIPELLSIPSGHVDDRSSFVLMLQPLALCLGGHHVMIRGKVC